MKKFIVALLIACFIAFPVSQIFADTDAFNDIEKHWAKDYIKKISKIDIVKGYPDGSFKPQRSVSKCESILMMYRMLDKNDLIDKSKEKLYTVKHKELMDEAAIPNWKGLREAVAYFLENNLIPEKDLSGFIHIDSKTGNELQVEIARERVSSYLASALSKILKQDMSGIIEITFNDFDKINKKYQPSIDFLYKKKIISGDNENKFNPKDSITRAEFTKLIIESIRVLDEEEKKEIETMKAVVKTKFDSLKRVIFYEVDDNTKSHIEVIDENVKILIDGKAAKYEDIKVDMIAKLSYRNKKLVKLEVSDYTFNGTEKTGVITEINENERYLYYKDSENGALNFLKVPNKVKIKLDGKDSFFRKGKVGHLLICRYDSDELVEIEYESKTKKYEGELISVDIASPSKITIKSQEKEASFEFDKEYKIYRNQKEAKLKDLKTGDKVFLETEYRKLVKLNAISDTTLVSGKLQMISQGAQSTIKILNYDAEEKSFTVKKDVVVKVDGRIVASVFDLKVGYSIKLKFDGEDLIEILAYSEDNNVGYVGYIESILKGVNVIIVSTENENLSLTVDKALIVNQAGEKVNLSSLKDAQKIFFYGIKNKEYVNVNKIMILEY